MLAAHLMYKLTLSREWVDSSMSTESVGQPSHRPDSRLGRLHTCMGHGGVFTLSTAAGVRVSIEPGKADHNVYS